MIGLVFFSDEMRRLQSYFGKTLNKDQLDIWFERFKNFENEEFKEAVMAVIENESRFPTPSVLAKFIDVARQERIRKSKVFTARAVTSSSFRDDEYIKDAKEALKLASSGLSKEALEVVFDGMAKKWPGKGWEKK